MNTITDYILNNHDNVLYIIAAISLLIELTIIGLSGPLLFFTIGCLFTGIFVSLGLISSWEIEVLFVGLISLAAAISLWKPLKKFQGNTEVKDQSSDLIGLKVVTHDVITNVSGSVRYSGINWPARLDDNASITEIPANTKVLVTGIDGNIMIVDVLED